MNNNGCILNNHSELGYRTKHGPALLISSHGRRGCLLAV